MGIVFKYFVLFVGLLPAGVIGVTVSDLYEVEVPIKDVLPESRRPAIRTALGMVLIKLTGDRSAPGNPALLPLLQRAENYRQEFKLNVEELLLWVRFDEEKLDNDIRNLGIPVWGKERPLTLIWLVVNAETGRQILGMDGQPEYIAIIDKRARHRGIDIIYPLLDLEDSAKLRPSDIWGGFRQPVLEASNRYPIDAILTGSIDSPVPGIWQGQWIAYVDGESKIWETEGDLPDIVIDDGIDGMSDFLAAKFVRSDVLEKSSVRITVADIYNADQYAETLKYLESLSPVTPQVQVSNVIEGEVTFILEAHGGCLAVSRAIVLGRRLEPIDTNECSKYRLLP